MIRLQKDPSYMTHFSRAVYACTCLRRACAATAFWSRRLLHAPKSVASALIIALVCMALPVGCSSSPGPRDDSEDAPDVNDNEDDEPARSKRVRTPLPAGSEQGFARLDELIQRWDNAQGAGEVDDAAVLKSQLTTESDLQFDTLVAAAEGDGGKAAQYLSVSSLGFSTRPEATKVLAAALSSSDKKLVGNALIALKLRADPATPLGPLMLWIREKAPREPRRYAPLAFANVMEARNRSGYPTEVAAERQALLRLHKLVKDDDPYVRLHVAKAMGALQNVSTHAQLKELIQDEKLRVRWAAAAAYERSGDIRGFPMVLRVLNDTPPRSKSIVRDVLVSYAGKLQGTPLTSDEAQYMGTNPNAWSTWFSNFKQMKGIDPNSELGAELKGT